jgi:hypothetical protein
MPQLGIGKTMVELTTVEQALVEQTIVAFDYKSEATENLGAKLDTDGSGTRPTLSVSRSKSFHLSFCWEPASKSTKRDMAAERFASCTKVSTIL